MDAERIAFAVLRHPAIAAAKQQVRLQLQATRVAQTQSGAQTLERALDHWTTAVILKAICDPERPGFVWWSEDTPHQSFGYEFPGSGCAGDNPDHIYRIARLDGSRSYEIKCGRSVNPPIQIQLDLTRDTGRMTGASSQKAGLDNHVGVLHGSDIVYDQDGGFSVTVGPEPAGLRRNHLQSVPDAPLQILLRNVLSDF